MEDALVLSTTGIQVKQSEKVLILVLMEDALVLENESELNFGSMS